MKNRHYILIILLLVLLSRFLYSQETKTDTINNWYKPTHFRLQYAGNIGMVSVGTSWLFLNKKLELSYSLGYSPEFATNRNIFTTSLKGLYKPKLNIDINNGFTIKPISIGLVISHTIGDRYNKYETSSKYPKNYYWWKAPIMNGIIYEAEIYKEVKAKHLNGLSFYFETSLWDLYIISKYDNSNNSYISFWDITTFGTGIKIYLK